MMILHQKRAEMKHYVHELNNTLLMKHYVAKMKHYLHESKHKNGIDIGCSKMTKGPNWGGGCVGGVRILTQPTKLLT